MTENQCDRYTLLGSRCQLERDHDGRHTYQMTSGTLYTWTDEEMARQADKYGSRFD